MAAASRAALRLQAGLFGPRLAPSAGLRSIVGVRTMATQSPSAICKSEVLEAQQKWADAIKDISRLYREGVNTKEDGYVARAKQAAADLYGYGYRVDSADEHSTPLEVAFKPTKAADYPFRDTPEGALSYFIGRKTGKEGFSEDGGFAINGGDLWEDVSFDNHQIQLHGDFAFAMGHYNFWSKSGKHSKVEYTFGYQRIFVGEGEDRRQELRIVLHHSSAPWQKGN